MAKLANQGMPVKKRISSVVEVSNFVNKSLRYLSNIIYVESARIPLPIIRGIPNAMASPSAISQKFVVNCHINSRGLLSSLAVLKRKDAHIQAQGI
jgi:hypothetical protein